LKDSLCIAAACSPAEVLIWGRKGRSMTVYSISLSYADVLECLLKIL